MELLYLYLISTEDIIKHRIIYGKLKKQVFC